MTPPSIGETEPFAAYTTVENCSVTPARTAVDHYEFAGQLTRLDFILRQIYLVVQGVVA